MIMEAQVLTAPSDATLPYTQEADGPSTTGPINNPFNPSFFEVSHLLPFPPLIKLLSSPNGY